MTDAPLTVPQWLNNCDEEVTRGGHIDVCGKTAVALRINPDGGEPYPTCPFHTRDDVVALADIAAAVTAAVNINLADELQARGLITAAAIVRAAL
jgi:hypothetical protein